MTDTTDTTVLDANLDAKNGTPDAMRDTAVMALEEAKGDDIRVLDVRGLTDITDFMVVASGASDRHVKALAERVRDEMREAGWRPIGIEGEEAQDWILLDFVDVVVHVMHPRVRAHYDLESLWDENLGEVLKTQREERA